jgi:hypothetical protein
MVELIEKYYLESVEGIKAEWFLNINTNWYDYITNLPVHLKFTYLVVVLQNQVFNGGFHQYFLNGYGQFAQETIIALLEIGAHQRSKLLEEAYKIINYENHLPEIFREKIISKELKSLVESYDLFDILDELDKKYYDINDEEIIELLGIYLENC